MIPAKDISINTYRDGSRYWHGVGKMTHLPTGTVIEFKESWDDRSDRERALKDLERIVSEKK